MQPLNYRQRLFVEHYLGESSGSAVDAARRAGYRCPQTHGPRLLTTRGVRAAIDARVETAAIAANARNPVSRAKSGVTREIREIRNPGNPGEIRCQFIILGEIRCQFIILARKNVGEIRCQFINLARKNEPTPDFREKMN